MANNARVPSGVLQGLYTPEFLPEELRLNEFVYSDNREENKKKLGKKKKESLRPQILDPATVPVPLTEAEAAEVDIAINATLKRLSSVREKIASTKDAINQSVMDSKGGAEIQFDVKVKGKPFLRKAIRKLFGEKRDTITYAMYLEALALKKRIEQEQAEGYTSGEFFSEERNLEEG